MGAGERADEIKQSNSWTKWGRAIDKLEHIDGRHWRGEVELRGLSLRVPQYETGEWLCVVKGTDHEGGPVVAFHSAQTGVEALAGAISRMTAGTLTWKADKYYG